MNSMNRDTSELASKVVKEEEEIRYKKIIMKGKNIDEQQMEDFFQFIYVVMNDSM